MAAMFGLAAISGLMVLLVSVTLRAMVVDVGVGSVQHQFKGVSSCPR
jgi:hypothetical protein